MLLTSFFLFILIKINSWRTDGFHKITSLDGGGLKFDRDEMEFSHPCFRRDQPFLLEHIKRKISTAKTASTDDKSTIKQEVVSKVLNDVKAMKGRQDSLDSRFVSMKQENEALWREVAILRQKHLKQQQIVNKLIQFLVTIVQPQRGSGISSMGGMGGVKRRYQLMINDVPDAAKVRKTGRTTSTSSGNEGPIIRELTEELLDNYNDADDEINSPYVVSPGFQSQSVANDCENFDNITDVEQMVDEEETGEVVNQTSIDDYTDYTTENIDTIAAAIADDAGPSNTSNKTRYVINGIGEEVPAELVIDASQLLEAQASQPQQPTQQKQTIPFVQPTKMNPVTVSTTGRMGVQLPTYRAERLTSVAPATAAAKDRKRREDAANLLRSSMGKSLLNAQKLKLVAAAKKQQQPQPQSQPQPQPQSQPQPQNIVQQHPQQPIVTSTAASAPQKSQMLLTAHSTAAPSKSYTNKNDFISAEMPKDLFEENEPLDDSLLPVDLIADGGSTIVDVDHLGNSYSPSSSTAAAGATATVPAATTAATSSSGPNMAVAKYNNEDLMTITSP